MRLIDALGSKRIGAAALGVLRRMQQRRLLLLLMQLLLLRACDRLGAAATARMTERAGDRSRKGCDRSKRAREGLAKGCDRMQSGSMAEEVASEQY
jgi:hypothetical protein